MAAKPTPLTAAELQELNRTVKSETGRRLLWEIHRLRALAQFHGSQWFSAKWRENS